MALRRLARHRAGVGTAAAQASAAARRTDAAPGWRGRGIASGRRGVASSGRGTRPAWARRVERARRRANGVRRRLGQARHRVGRRGIRLARARRRLGPARQGGGLALHQAGVGTASRRAGATTCSPDRPARRDAGVRRASASSHQGVGLLRRVMAVSAATNQFVATLPPLPPFQPYVTSWNAAVLCAAAAGDCDHLDCHRGAFLVCFVASYRKGTVACVYSSESDAWGEPTSTPRQDWFSDSENARAAHVGNALYFVLDDDYDATMRILMFDLSAREIVLIQQPPMWSDDYSIALTTAEGGGLGAATVEEGSKLHLWSWEPTALNSGDNIGWTQQRVIDFKLLIPNCPFVHTPDVVGFAEGGGVVCIGVDQQFYTYDLKSERLRQQVIMPAI
ncbi:hypothetical protein EJB05_14805, partial [Eragrostis curvula]